jgi:hypothetical protein
MTGWEIFFVIASILLSYAMAPKQQSRKPEAFDEIEFPQADEGTPQAVTFGDCWSGDWMVLAYGNYRTEEIRSPDDKK